MVFTSYRVGAKNSGTRFLSFVDTMLGYRHLLTPEDINKAASMCTSLKGVLRSRFLVLSDDRDPPPPPARGKRGHPDSVGEPVVSGKRFQATVQINQQSATSEVPGQALGQREQTLSQSNVQSQVNNAAPVQELNSSTPFEPVRSRRTRRLPTGVKAIPVSARITPDRQAKTGRQRPSIVPPQPNPEAIDIDIDVDVDDEISPQGSDMEANSGDSTNTVVDWVSCG